MVEERRGSRHLVAAPHLVLALLHLERDERVELERRSEAGAHLVLVLDLEHGGLERRRLALVMMVVVVVASAGGEEREESARGGGNSRRRCVR